MFSSFPQAWKLFGAEEITNFSNLVEYFVLYNVFFPERKILINNYGYYFDQSQTDSSELESLWKASESTLINFGKLLFFLDVFYLCLSNYQ